MLPNGLSENALDIETFVHASTTFPVSSFPASSQTSQLNEGHDKSVHHRRMKRRAMNDRQGIKLCEKRIARGPSIHMQPAEYKLIAHFRENHLISPDCVSKLSGFQLLIQC